MFNNIYESNETSEVFGCALRPGGFSLTDKAVRLCGWTSKDRLLDVGCGQGATLAHLKEQYGILGTGVDVSLKLLNVARKRDHTSNVLLAKGENLPFDNAIFDGAIAECSLSVMCDIKQVLSEINRVLKHGGYAYMSDIYARNWEFLQGYENHRLLSSMGALYGIDALKNIFIQAGYSIVYVRDHSEVLKDLWIKMIWEGLSQEQIWKKLSGEADCGSWECVKACKPGYYMAVLKKEDVCGPAHV